MRARNDAFGQAGELRDMDAIGAIRRALHDFMQKHDVARMVGDFHGEIYEARKALRELREFVKMRGEKGARPIDLVEMLDRRPGDGEPVEGRRAASDLIEDNQRARRRAIEDGGGFDHLDHEGRASARKIVGRADAREKPVHDADPGRERRNE